MPKVWTCIILLLLSITACTPKVKNSVTSGNSAAVISDTPPFLKSCAALVNIDAQVACSNNTILGYIQSEMDYPVSARKVGLQGTVIISAVINQYGIVTDVKLEQGIAPMLNNEAIKLVKNLPSFVPATKNAIPQPCRVTFPIEFNLEE